MPRKPSRGNLQRIVRATTHVVQINKGAIIRPSQGPAAGATSRLDSPAVVANPFPVYERLRREEPVYRTRMTMSHLGDDDVYVLSRYRDCVNLLTDERMHRSVQGPVSPWLPRAFRLLTSDSMIVKDPPQHSRLRKLASRAFSRKAVARMSDRIDALTTDLLGEFSSAQRVDLQAEYAMKIPFTVLSAMVCADEADQARFPDVSRMLATLSAPQHGIGEMVSRVDRTAQFVRDMIRRRRAEPADDVVTALTYANEDGDSLSEDEVIAMVFLLVVADLESTCGLISNGIAALLTHPDQLDLLKTDPGLIDSAVEEILRFTGTIGSTEVYYPREDIELHSVTIPVGAKVIPLLAAANRDSTVFDSPETFDITRTPNPHIAFGKGAHFCLGAQLARLETRLAISNLVGRFPEMRLDIDPANLQIAPAPLLMRRLTGLPVVLN